MIYTASYFEIANHYGELISISNRVPKGFKVDREFSSFRPDWELVHGFKEGYISWEKYVELYEKYLWENWGKTVLPGFLDKFNKDRDCTLLCWCKDINRCHRSLAGKFLKKRGYSVTIK